MQAVFASIIPWLSLAFLFFAAFLTLGVNLMPGMPGSRIGLAVTGLMLVFGGMQVL
jgi:hypothetical protein